MGEQGRRRFLSVERPYARIEGLLHQAGDQRSRCVVAHTHPRDWSCLEKWPGPALPRFGVDTFSFNNRYSNSTAGTELTTRFEDLALDVAVAVDLLRDHGYERVVLYGHSAGGPTMAFYQAVAAQGVAVATKRDDLGGFSGFEAASACSPADGIVFGAATVGTGASFLVRLDPAVDDATGRRDPDLDMYRPENGFDPATGSGRYTPEFLRRFRQGQAARMDRLVDWCRSPSEGTAAAPAGQRVLTVLGTRADPLAVDRSLARESVRPYRHLPSGRDDVVRSTRLLRPREHLGNVGVAGLAVHLDWSFLSYRAVRTTDRYADTPTGLSLDGIDYASVQSSMPGNLDHVDVPVLMIQGTSDADVQIPSAEVNFAAASAAEDKELVFVEGADHFFAPTAERFGDTRATAAQAMATWVRERFG